MNTPDFLKKHGIRYHTDIEGYQYATGLYLSYLIKSMQLTEEIEDGIFFEVKDVEILLQNLEEAQKTQEYFKKKLKYDFTTFDAAEVIHLKGCRIECGQIIGDKESAAEIARMWIKSDTKCGKKSFMYEIAVYILFLLGQEVEYP